MTYIKITSLILILTFFDCKQKTNKVETEIKTEHNKPSLTNDTVALKKLTKDLYQWVETKNSNNDFIPLKIEKMDTVYTRIDLARHKQRLKELKEIT